MKKTLVTLLLIIMGIGGVKAQIELTPQGLRFTESDQDYIVLEYPGKDAHQIFDLYKKHFSAKTMNEKEVKNLVDDQQLTVTTTAPNAFYFKAAMGMNKMSFNLTYTLNFEFKDGKVKVYLPVINRMHNVEKGPQRRDLLVFISKELQNENPSSQGCIGCVVYIYEKKDKLKLETAKETLETFLNSKLSEIKSIQSKKTDW